MLANSLVETDVRDARLDTDSAVKNARKLRVGGVGVEAVAKEVLQAAGPVLCRLCGSGNSASQLIERLVANGRLL